MRKPMSWLGVVLLAGGLSAVASVNAAHAQCPVGDGTIPGSSSSMIAIGEQTVDPNANTPFRTIYIFDEDALDLDEDGVAGGLSIYFESNNQAGFQRDGGKSLTFQIFDPNIPFIPPVYIPDADEPLVILFPEGVGGGSLSEALHKQDTCPDDDSPNPDFYLF